MSGFGKRLRGTFSQAEGLNFIHENIYVIKVKASRILWDGKLARVRFTPLIYYPVSWVMSTWVNFHLHLSACVVRVFFFLPSLCLSAGAATSGSAITSNKKWYNNIFIQVLRSPRRGWQWLPSAPAVRFVCSGSESNQLSMINMENSHCNHSFLWETTVRLCIKPWVNKPPPPALLVTDQMVELK